jgi:DNA-binding beta-propeller fold protein YncE
MTLTENLIRLAVLNGSLMVMAGSVAAQTPSPALVITTKGKALSDSALLIVDPLARKLAGRVPIGGHPHDVAVSADGKFAYVTNTTYGVGPELVPEDTIAVIDLAAQKESRRFEVGPGSWPHGIVFAGGKVYFASEGYRLVGRYDPASNRIDWIAGINQNRVHELVITKDTKRIFTSNIGSDTVAGITPVDMVADVETFPHVHPPPPWHATIIPVGNGPEAIAMSPNEKEVWTLTRGDGSVSIIDADTKKVLQNLNLKTKDPLRLTFTPDGNRVLIADGSTGEMLILNVASRKEIKRLKNVGKNIHGIVVAPDGLLAYATAVNDHNVAIIDMKTLELVARIPTGADAETEDIAWVERK